ncbi:MAG: hypothetical protein Q9159_004934 [Coniocarpon cinnabarinum]
MCLFATTHRVIPCRPVRGNGDQPLTCTSLQQDQLDDLRNWGECLTATPKESDAFAARLRDLGHLRDALRTHLSTLLTLLKQEEAKTPSSFKIAGIDVLASPSIKLEDEGTRRKSMEFSAITRYITDLAAFEGSPSQYPSYEQARPSTRRSGSSFDDAKDGSDPSSAASVSPVAASAQSTKRRRRFSISSSNGGQTPVNQISPNTDNLAQQLQAMPGTTSRLSPQSATQTTLPPLSQTLQPGPPPTATAPRMRSPYDASQYPSPHPQLPPTHPYQPPGLVPPPPQHLTFSQYPPPPVPQPAPPNTYPPPQIAIPEKRPPKRAPSTTGPPPTSQPGPRVVPQTPHRLLIPNQQGEDPGSAVTPSPKLTKTGRVSKALRGEPVHACNICEKVYTRAEHLRRHRSNHRVNLLRNAPPGPSPTNAEQS